MQKYGAKITCVALMALASLSLAAGAQAKLTGEFTKFVNCPFESAEVKHCIVSTVESGEVVLGNQTVPIEKPVVLQGGYGKQVKGISKFFGAANGVTFSVAPQNVPGGLAAIVPEKESPALVKALIKSAIEKKQTSLSSTVELARPASEIRISELRLVSEEGVALELPVKAHLENPLLGHSCFVGSSSSPIVWKLTSGTTAPPEPNKPINGFGGEGELLEENAILSVKNNKLVDNAWPAPKATGCGGILSFLVTPIVNAQLGTTTAGHNTVILSDTISAASSLSVIQNNELNP